MSGFLGNLLGSLMGGGQAGSGTQAGTQGAGGVAGIAGLVGQAINAAGGPAGILQKFQQAGLGNVAQSWVGSGENQSVSPQQVQSVFPTQQIDAWAQQHGIPAGMASQVLAQFLPHAVDAQTPNGAVPPSGTPQADPSNIDFAGLIGRLTGRG